MQICYVDIAGHWALPVIKGSKTKVKAWIILLTCSWSRFVKIQPLTKIDADSVLAGLTVALASIGCSLPKVIASDQGSQIIKMGDVMGDTELDTMSDEEYNRLKYKLVRQGVVMRNTTALSPWKQGKVERLIRILKQAIKVNGLKG